MSVILSMKIGFSFLTQPGYNNNAFENLYENLYFVEQVSSSLLFEKKSVFLKEYESLLH